MPVAERGTHQRRFVHMMEGLQVLNSKGCAGHLNKGVR